jgi:hypothetical protein
MRWSSSKRPLFSSYRTPHKSSTPTFTDSKRSQTSSNNSNCRAGACPPPIHMLTCSHAHLPPCPIDPHARVLLAAANNGVTVHCLLCCLLSAARPLYSKTQSLFKSMEVTNKHFTAFIDIFTTNTYAMIIMSNPKIRMPSAPSPPHLTRWLTGLRFAVLLAVLLAVLSAVLLGVRRARRDETEHFVCASALRKVRRKRNPTAAPLTGDTTQTHCMADG